MIITIANNKGGVLKTTIATHLATWLCRQGQRVALVDLDTQGSVARFLGVEAADDLYELVVSIQSLRADRRPPITSFLTPVPGYRDLALVRGWGRSARLEVELNRPGSRTARDVLQEIVAPLESLSEGHVILDTGPYAGILQEAALAVADHVLVPGIPEAATETGVLDVAQRLQRLGRGITGVIPTKVKPRTREHTRTIKDWTRALGRVVYYDPPRGLVGLPDRVFWGELVRHGRPIWDVAPRFKGAREMEAVLRRIVYDTRAA